MSEEELIETLRTFEKNRVEQLEEPARNLFYAIMKIANERDRLNNIINELEKELNKDFNTYMTGNRQNGKIYKAGANNYRMHIYLRLKELKGSEKDEYK